MYGWEVSKMTMFDQVQEEVVKAALRFSEGQTSLYLNIDSLKKSVAAATVLVKGRAYRRFG